MSIPQFGPCPPRFADLKRAIADAYGGVEVFSQRATRAWSEILAELELATAEIVKRGPEVVPQVAFSDLESLNPVDIDNIRRRGCVVIRDVVDDDEAAQWRTMLREYVKTNPVEGFPEEDKQFFQLYWTKPQVLARAHPNVLKASAWLNKMYHLHPSGGKGTNTPTPTDVDLSLPLSYADRFRMRHPGIQWDAHPPHIDGGSIERWEDAAFRSCFDDILRGDSEWRKHDPYDLAGRVNARSSLYGRPNQSTVFRTYQGWLAFSEAAPHQGTLQVFPDILLANAYTILRPFFRAVDEPQGDPLAVHNWVFDITSPDFPGIFSLGNAFTGPRPTPQTHPHLRLETAMTSVPRVAPGDMVFWHCDLIHAVERDHTGADDSCVMYIPAVPYTPQNASYVARQRESFLRGVPPPDFPQWEGEGGFVGRAGVEDVVGVEGRRAMGFEGTGAAVSVGA